MARVAEHLSIAELEERFRTAKDPILARHVQVIWLLAQGHTSAEVSTVTSFAPRWIEQLRAPLQGRGLCGPGRPASAQWARAEPAQAGPVGALARPPGRSAARWRAVDEWESGVLDGRRARACLGLCPTWLGGSARDRVVDPEAAPASSEGGHARGGIHV